MTHTHTHVLLYYIIRRYTTIVKRYYLTAGKGIYDRYDINYNTPTPQ